MNEMLHKFPFLKERRNQQYILIAVLVLWIGMLLILGVIPGVKQALSSRSIAQTARLSLDDLNAKLDLIKKAQESLDSIASYEDTAVSSLPVRDKVITLFNAVALTANANSLAVTRLDYTGLGDAGEGLDGVKTVRFAFSAEGEYPDILSFVDTLENMPRLINVSAVSVASGNERATNPDDTPIQGLTLDIEGEAYFYE